MQLRKVLQQLYLQEFILSEDISLKFRIKQLFLDPYSRFPSYRVGLEVYEETITSDISPDLNDNAQGFSNFTATGADRLVPRAYLTKRPTDGIKYEKSFIELMEVSNAAKSVPLRKDTEYNEICKEFAKRTYDESGDLLCKRLSLQVKETLNNLKGNRGVFVEGENNI